MTTPGKFVSLSFWRDEEALAEWRSLASHRAAQTAGRTRMFTGYRLRVAAVIRDYGLEDRTQAPRGQPRPARVMSHTKAFDADASALKLLKRRTGLTNSR